MAFLKLNTKGYSNDKTWFAELSTIFDLQGFLIPTIIQPKQIIQLLWQRKIYWDDPLPQDLEIRWKNWIYQFK